MQSCIQKVEVKLSFVGQTLSFFQKQTKLCIAANQKWEPLPNLFS